MSESARDAALLELLEYVEHGAWRCHYRKRYKRCVCGLDDLMETLGLPPVPVDDPEAPAPSSKTGLPGEPQ